jgi:hypothetical protein
MTTSADLDFLLQLEETLMMEGGMYIWKQIQIWIFCCNLTRKNPVSRDIPRQIRSKVDRTSGHVVVQKYLHHLDELTAVYSAWSPRFISEAKEIGRTASQQTNAQYVGDCVSELSL